MRVFELPEMTFSNTKRTSLGKIKRLLNRNGKQNKKQKCLAIMITLFLLDLVPWQERSSCYVGEEIILRFTWQVDKNKKEM